MSEINETITHKTTRFPWNKGKLIEATASA